jgi:hypothetical protein
VSVPVHRMKRFVLAMLCLVCVGCGPPQTFVAGTVTFDGAPVEKAGIEFHATGRGGFTGVAFTDADGRYRARVAPSALTAVIRAYRVVGKEKSPRFEGGPLEDELQQYLPPRYSDPGKSELRIAPVSGRTTVADFALTSDK